MQPNSHCRNVITCGQGVFGVCGDPPPGAASSCAGAKGGTFFVAGQDEEFGTVANTVIYRHDGTSPFTVDLEAFLEGPGVTLAWRTLTAERIAT